MAEFEDKLNALLSDPNSMAQIMQLAQSLSGGQNAAPPGGGVPPSGAAGDGPAFPSGGIPSGQSQPPQGGAGGFGSQPANSSNSGPAPPNGGPGPSGAKSSPDGVPFGSGGFNPGPSGGSSGTPGPQGNPISSLLGGMDPALLARLMPLVQELGSQQNSNARALLYALRPYLKPERQEKIERALQLARLVHIGKKFIAGWEA